MTPISVTNPIYSAADQSAIDCLVEWEISSAIAGRPATLAVPAVLDEQGNVVTPAIPATEATPDIPAVTMGPFPFTAHKDDIEPHAAALYADLVAGKYGAIGVYVAPTLGVDELVAYAITKRDGLLAGGVQVNVSPAGQTAVTVLCDGTNGSRTDLLTLFVLAGANSSFTSEWTDNNNVKTPLSAAQILILAPAIMAWYQHLIDTLSAVITAIERGTITTTTAIDAYAWPTS